MAKFCRKCGAPLPAGKSGESGSLGSQQPEVLICPKCGKNLAKKSKAKAIPHIDKTEVLAVNNGQPAANPDQPAQGNEKLQPLVLAGQLAALQQGLPPSLTQKASASPNAAASPKAAALHTAASNAPNAAQSSKAAAHSPAAASNATQNAIAALNQNTSAHAPNVNMPLFAALKPKKRKPKSKFFRILQIIIIACLAFAAVYYGHKLYSWYCSIRQAATILISDYKKPSSKKDWPISPPTSAKTPAASPSLSPAESPAPASGLPETPASPQDSPTPAENSAPAATEQNPAPSDTSALPTPGETAQSAPAQPAPEQSAQNDITIPLAPNPPANPNPSANTGNTSVPTPITVPAKPSAVREPVIQGRYAFFKAEMESSPEQHQLALEQFLKSSILIANNDGTLEVMEINNNPYSISNDGYKYELKPQTIKIMGTHKAGTGNCAIQGKCKVSEVFSTPHSYSPTKGKETKTQYNSKDYTLSYLGSGEIKQFPGHNQESLSITFTLNYDAEGKENNIEHSYHANGGQDSNTSNKIIDNHWNEPLTVTYIKISD